MGASLAILVTLIAAASIGRFVWLGGDDASAARTNALDPAALEARVAANPDDGAAWQALSVRYIAQASGSGDRAKVQRAEHAVSESVRLRPADLTTFRVKGSLELTLHHFAAAHATGLAARAAHPDSPDALTILIDASIELGRYDEAAGYLQVLLDRRPDAAALARVSYLREIHGDTAGARLAMAQAETAATANADETATIAVLVGDLALAEGDAATAQAAYDRAERLAPGRPLALIGQARALYAIGRDNEALALLVEASRTSGEPAVWTALGDLQAALGFDGDAQATYATSRSLIARHGASGEDNDLEVAQFESDHGDPAAGVTYAQRAYTTRPTVFTADALGWALTSAGRRADAVPYVEEALRLGTASAEFHVHAAVTFRAIGDTDRARHELDTAFARSPWPTIALRAEASDLAKQIEAPIPTAWSP